MARNETDLPETHDLAASQPQLRDELHARLEAWHKSLPEPAFTNTGIRSNYQRRSVGLPEIPGLPR